MLTRKSAKALDEIIDRIADGESLTAICRNSRLPSKRSVMRWLDADSELSKRYARACEMRAEVLFEKIDEVVNNTANDWVPDTRPGHEGEMRFNKAQVARDRLRFDALRWMAAKLAPKKYGDRITSEHTSSGGVPLIPTLSLIMESPDYTHADNLERVGAGKAPRNNSGYFP